jgi:hypothetical protein
VLWRTEEALLTLTVLWLCISMRGGGSLMRVGASSAVEADSGRSNPPLELSGSGGNTSMLEVSGTSDQPAVFNPP